MLHETFYMKHFMHGVSNAFDLLGIHHNRQKKGDQSKV